MYKLYNVKAWGSMGVHFLLEEMDVPYTNIWMTPEQVAAPEYRELSPLGYIPALGLDDGSALFESAAIVSFLVTAHPDKGMAPQPGSNEYGEFLSWLHFMSTNLYVAINMGDSDNFYARNATEEAFLVGKSIEKMQPALGHPGQAPGGRRAVADGREFFGARHLCLHAVLLEQAKGNSSPCGIPGHRKTGEGRAGAAKTQGGAGSPWRDGAAELTCFSQAGPVFQRRDDNFAHEGWQGFVDEFVLVHPAITAAIGQRLLRRCGFPDV